MAMMDKKLIPYDSFDAFLESLHPETPLIETIRAHAENNHVPAIPQSIAVFLTMLIRLQQPKNILELGTGTGLSALTMAQAMPRNGHIYTVEINDERIKTANKFISDSPYAKMIDVIQADFRSPEFFSSTAVQYAPYDFIFIDAAKGKYHGLVEVCAPLLKNQGLIVLDDALQNHWVVTLDYPTHRNKTSVVNLRRFLEEMANNKQFHMSLFSIDDGIVVLEKLEAKEEEDQ